MKFVVYNPVSGNGRTGRHWPAIARKLEAAIGPFEAVATRCPDDATALVRSAVGRGFSDIVAAGGDGTINEAANGLFDESGHPLSGVTFRFLTSGSGGDFRRSLNIDHGIEAGCAALSASKVRPLDIGRIVCQRDGRQVVRYFVNVASLGLSGVTARAVNGAGLSRLLGPKAMFRYHSVASLLRYRFQSVTLDIDGVMHRPGPIATVVIANGGYFGGGMKIAPDADPADGVLSVIIVRGTSKADLIGAMNLVYSGRHVSHPSVSVLTGRRIVVTPIDEAETGPVFIEADGETPGYLPATFEVMPRALSVHC